MCCYWQDGSSFDGLRLPRKNVADADTVLPDEANRDVPGKTPLDVYKAKLQKLGGYTISTVDLVSSPLPEERLRTWILGSRDDQFGAETWRLEVLSCAEKMAAMKRRTLHPVFEKFGERPSLPSLGSAAEGKAAKSWEQDAQYTTAFAAALERPCQS